MQKKIKSETEEKIQQETEQFEKIYNQVTQKEYEDFDESMNSLTVLCYLKEVSEQYILTFSTQSHNLFNTLLIFLFQNTMLTCMLLSLWAKGAEEQKFSTEFMVTMVKLPAAVALHLCLYPEVMEGMKIMKFANNQSHLFVNNGSRAAYLIGYFQYLTSVYCEGINVYLLTFQQSVELSIIHFVALEVIMELPKMYYESLSDNKLKIICHEHYKRPKRGRHIEMKDRDWFHKIGRVNYRMLRSIYVSVVFYFVPFTIIALSRFLAMVPSEGEAKKAE